MRIKPDKVKQSGRTKAAAAVFGLVSAKERLFRHYLLYALGFPPLQYLAARHRARLRKTILPAADAHSGKPVFGNPEALKGFEFNPVLEWSRCTNFYPSVQPDGKGGLKIGLPELKWGTELLPPTGTTAVRLILYAAAVNLNGDPVIVRNLAGLDFHLTRGTIVEAQTWQIPAAEDGHWTLLVGSIYFDQPGKAKIHSHAASYLWVKDAMADE